ncbi:CHAD domain-containing protein [Deefgea sp. CFH1-16]|uniref:CHAD domain-containing protein n=1 Tax=Deefgea sp. CFH1-16 TaxID=2675457 RepID=UPI0015F3905F|nr:CHAD domain-containing protein [Deefgea sp. CFH1-16]
MPKKNDFLHSIAKQLIILDRAKNKIIKGKNSEALHQFRVALRRLRCLLPIVFKIQQKTRRGDFKSMASARQTQQPNTRCGGDADFTG